jgi:endonuclease/exonuclease/phosphatase family metal-dependent hydrolase
MNLLAPFYHALGIDGEALSPETLNRQRQDFMVRDRIERIPMAIRMAKQTNADILCLQEIEGEIRHHSGSPHDGSEQCNHHHGWNPQVEEWLKQDELYGTNTFVQGYDSFVWNPLNPNNRRGDPVGLCIAWRSHRHKLLSWEGYKRGMVCQFQEVIHNYDDNNENSISKGLEAEGGGGGGGSSFVIANLHLPARPSNILGRLKTMARTVQKLETLDRNRPHHPASTMTYPNLDGLVIVAGDFNSDQNSVAAQLLKRGSSPYGNLRDRNYKAKVTKSSALEMRHPFRFQDIYDEDINLRNHYAPITVSLKGRGPGCMDHLFYAVAPRSANKNVHYDSRSHFLSPSRAERIDSDMGKRRVRRKKAETRQKLLLTGAALRVSSSPRMQQQKQRQNASLSLGSAIGVASVLATINGPDDPERIQLFAEGLPNPEQGFPSDHLPVGALFVGAATKAIYSYQNCSAPQLSDTESIAASLSSSSSSSSEKIRGVSSTVHRRRLASRTSFGLRRRHNAVLNSITDWLVGRGMGEVVRDQPLYKNELLARTAGVQQRIKRKSRAPDLMGIVYGRSSTSDDHPIYNNSFSFVIVEVAVTAETNRVRKQKLDKYQDLVKVLSDSSEMFDFRMTQCHLFAIVIHEDGSISKETRLDLERLALLTSSSEMGDIPSNSKEIAEEVTRLTEHLRFVVCSFHDDESS